MPRVPLFLLLVILFGCSHRVVRITSLDVGEGDATLIRFPSGENVLIDAGNVTVGVRVVEMLRERGVDRLDALILTHPHPDHTGGAFTVAELLPVDSIYDNGEELSEAASREDFYRWYREYFRDSRGARALSSGEVLSFREASLTVLWPRARAESADWNTNSLVLRLDCETGRALFMGDANGVTEEALVAAHADLRADLLKVGHHGAKDATTEAFLKEVKPEVALVSVNRGNIRAYPDPAVLNRLRESGAEVRLTSRDGTTDIELNCAEGTVRVQRERAED